MGQGAWAVLPERVVMHIDFLWDWPQRSMRPAPDNVPSRALIVSKVLHFSPLPAKTREHWPRVQCSCNGCRPTAENSDRLRHLHVRGMWPLPPRLEVAQDQRHRVVADSLLRELNPWSMLPMLELPDRLQPQRPRPDR